MYSYKSPIFIDTKYKYHSSAYDVKMQARSENYEHIIEYIHKE